jgi:hypothetical protein
MEHFHTAKELAPVRRQRQIADRDFLFVEHGEVAIPVG